MPKTTLKTTVKKTDKKTEPVKEKTLERKIKFNVSGKTTVTGQNSEKLKNCTIVNDIKGYKEKFKQ